MLYAKLQTITGFPCLTCPFIRVQKNDEIICGIYSHNSVGIESCQEVASYLNENCEKKLELNHILSFN